MTPPNPSDQGNMVSQRQGEWVLVPREPTEAMKEAAFGPIRDGGRHGPITSDHIRQRAALSVYRMMIDAAPPAEPRADDGVVERHMLSEPDSENPSIEGLVERLPSREQINEVVRTLRDENDTCLRWKETTADWLVRFERDRSDAANTISRLKGEQEKAGAEIERLKKARDAAQREADRFAEEADTAESRSLQLEAEVNELRSGLEKIASGTFDGDLALAASGRWDRVVVQLQDIARSLIKGEG